MRKTGARADWETRTGRRTAAETTVEQPPPPGGLEASSGAGQVTLRWRPVGGAIGYLVHRASSPQGPFTPVDHRGGDVLANPGPVYADTTGRPGERCWYAVSSVVAVEASEGELSAPVEARPSGGAPDRPLQLRVRADKITGRLERPWRMIGSERLSQLLIGERTGGRPVAEEFAEALRLAHEELGAERVRAHAILHDDVGIYPGYDFSRLDAAYDRLLAVGLRPVVEVSFMPSGLAADPDATVFEYGAVISPPRDWEEWAELTRRLAAHLVDRYGVEEVAQWGFEIWNEANLEVFWSGTQAEYFRLYETAARAIKAVDERLLVGGPSTAAAGWVVDFLDFVEASEVPLDFLSTHTYGNVPLDLRQALAVRGLDRVEVWWTEWGVSPTHFADVTDAAFGAPFVLHGMKSVQGRAEALAYWVVSDHFEELGRPRRLLHGGFGLLTVGNLRKPRWWALRLAEELDDTLVEAELEGDGAGSLVDAWASRGDDGTIQILAWNGTLDQTKARGEPLLDRTISIQIDGLDRERYRVSLARVDNEHSALSWGDGDWPGDDEWAALRLADRLWEEELPDLPDELDLPMPGVARLKLTPRR